MIMGRQITRAESAVRYRAHVSGGTLPFHTDKGSSVGTLLPIWVVGGFGIDIPSGVVDVSESGTMWGFFGGGGGFLGKNSL